jgi:hypothetical protein
MKICVTQREGIRHFAKFTNLGERDKLYVEVTVEDKNGSKPILIDLTSALIQEYSKHPELGKPEPAAVEEVTRLQPIKKLVTKAIKEVTPAYLTESKKQKEEILSKVREAQQKLADERKCKAADQATARAERLAATRKAKAENKAADSGKGSKKTVGNLDSTTKAGATLTKTQQAAIKKISKVLAEEEKTNASTKSSTAATKRADTNVTTAKTKAKTDSTNSTNKVPLSSATKKARSNTATDQVKTASKAKPIVQETQPKKAKAASRTTTSASKLAASER